ncbi:MAG: B-box zinc finger protein [Candidatus Freyarchaeota archaeon]
MTTVYETISEIVCFVCKEKAEYYCEDCGRPVCANHSTVCDFCGKRLCLNCDY